MIVYLLKHGETAWNVDGRLQGSRADVPMNRRGIEETMALGEKLRDIDFSVDCIISSPAIRAHKCAEIIASSIGYSSNIISDCEFRGRDFGTATGLVWNSSMIIDSNEYKGESIASLCERSYKALTSYYNMYKTILIVAHGSILAGLITAVSLGDVAFKDARVPVEKKNLVYFSFTPGAKVEEFNYIFDNN